ncbi:Cytochrome p450 [Thalictrum thalictroides]|uniref:Cytochrome p450 n=1 Tax=Thalictrum thalictroides TaxID=46969 RepID=A0A7J6XE97_THATH|nr:Cytochrome p450 [Thalictrum thalictroides]
MMSTKEDILQTLVVIVGVVLVSWAWKTISSIWLKPKKMEKYLREQGLKGPNYKFLYGDTKEIGRLTKEARSKPMENSHQIVRRVFPYYHQVVQQFLPTKTNNRMKEIHREVRTLLRDMILKREKAMKVGEAPTNDLLGILMESNFKEIKEGGNSKVGMSIDDVIEECMLFYFAGQETTATLLAWAMVVLSMHQDWQQKAREEVMQVFGSNKVEYDGLNRLKVVSISMHI